MKRKIALLGILFVVIAAFYACETVEPFTMPDVSHVGNVATFKLFNTIDGYYFRDPTADGVTINLYLKNKGEAMQGLTPGTDLVLMWYLWLDCQQFNPDALDKLYYDGTIYDYDFNYDEDLMKFTITMDPDKAEIGAKVLAAWLKTGPTNSGDVKYIGDELGKSVEQGTSNIESYIFDLPLKIFLSKHPYNAMNANSYTLSKVTLKDCQTLYNRLVAKSNITVAVRGDLKETVVISQLGNALAGVPKAPSETMKQLSQEIDTGAQLKTNFETFYSSTAKSTYLHAYFPGPMVNSDAFFPYWVGVKALDARIFVDIRIKGNFSYTPYAYTLYRKASYSGIFLSTKKPTEALQALRATVQKFLKEGISDRELTQVYETAYTQYYLDTETPKGQFDTICASLRRFNDIDTLFTSYLPTIKAVTAAQVNAAMKKYLTNFVWGVISTSKEDIASLDPNLLFYVP